MFKPGLLVVASALVLAACNQQQPDTYVATDSATSAAVAESIAAAEQERARAAEAERQRQLALYQDCINATFASDSATSAIASKAQRVAAMRAIDTSGCPADFRTAYFDHIAAWERRARIDAAWNELNSEQNIDATLLGSLVTTALDIEASPIADHIEAENRLKAAAADVDVQINDTFRQAERVALSYGISHG